MVKFKVIVSGQPAAFVPTCVYVPELVYVVPFKAHVYESHAVSATVAVVELLIIKLSVVVNGHPAAFVPTCVCIPELVYVVPFNGHV